VREAPDTAARFSLSTVFSWRLIVIHCDSSPARRRFSQQAASAAFAAHFAVFPTGLTVRE